MMLVFRPNFGDLNLPPQHLMADLDSFSHASCAFAYGLEENYVAFSANVNGKGFSETKGNKTLEDWIKDRFFATDIRSSIYPPGHYYKRMWRPPGYISRDLLVPNLKVLTQSAITIDVLIKKLQELFFTVEPATQNLTTFGHKMREILLLACMEVETSWAGILKEHGYVQARYTTNDYVKLLEPMCLSDYEVRLRWYPDFPSLRPFSNWQISKPTQSLSWFAAYNAIKHDRENNLCQATLCNVVESVGAAVVMFCAQFGIPEGERITEAIQSMFDVYLVDSSPERSYIPLNKYGIVSPFTTWIALQHTF